MAEPIIEVEDLSKRYQLGNIGTGTLSHDLNRWWQKKTGKQDPYAPELYSDLGKSVDYIWSLKDVEFEVKKGEVFGIIGKNGAGKSTLLKLLSKISKPTTGKIKIDGRIASLLEVGTGFHPDLTGRQNVFLNGAILGMTKSEIKMKFDEIISFSGVERFIDTPVKRYSSGMYVRLAFAVAAHLEPEILIIDEVLAVGDVEFQQKCLGKIQDVSQNQGRTVLFVSHSIPAIKQLCTKVMLLEQGRNVAIGSVEDVLRDSEQKNMDSAAGLRAEMPNTSAYFISWKIQTNDLDNDGHSCYSRDDCTFIFTFRSEEFLSNGELRFVLKNKRGIIIYVSSLSDNGTNFSLSRGTYQLKLSMNLPLVPGDYLIEVALTCRDAMIDHWNSSTLLKVLDNYSSRLGGSILNIPSTFRIEEVTSDLGALQVS